MIFLKPFELAWRAVNRVRRALYRTGMLRAARLARPVISVGNLSAGGAGKTPAVIAIARHLIRKGFRVAVLTRGYGKASETGGLVDHLDPLQFGDEPVLIKMSIPNVDVIVGRNRYQNARQFITMNDCDVFLLDDGFQHLQLARDVDIVIDAPGSRWQREGRSALRDANFILPRKLSITNADQIRGRRVFAFSGLANNQQFFDSVSQCGAILTGSRGFPDHHRYTPQDLQSVRRHAASTSAEILVTTQKDAVKFNERDIIPLVAEMAIDPEVLEAIIRRVSSISP